MNFKKFLILLNSPPTQLAVASDGESSYAIFLYPEGGIEWIRGEGKSGNMGDARAQAGIISGEGINYIFPESGTDQVRNLDAWSNMNEAGVYVFKIGGRDVDVAGGVIQGRSKICSLGCVTPLSVFTQPRGPNL